MAPSASPHQQSPEPRQPTNGEILHDIVRDLLAKQQALSDLIDRRLAGEGEGSPEVETRELARLMALHSQNAARLGRLLRDKYALSGDEGDSWDQAIGEALDALSAQWGVKL